jgi:alanine racemase
VPWPCLLEVDLEAVAWNWRSLARGPTAGVVKADGYGLGAPQVAARLHAEGCRHFFVAHPDEAAAIRGTVPGAMVAVLNGLWPGLEAWFAAHDVTPVLGSLAEVDAWAAQARRLGRALPALLHVDTGMNRLGLDPPGVAALAADPRRLDGIALRYVMTHLVSAEHPDDPINERQRLRFAAARARLPPAPASFAGGRFRLRLGAARRGAVRHQSDAGAAQPDAPRGAAARPGAAGARRSARRGRGLQRHLDGAAAQPDRHRQCRLRRRLPPGAQQPCHRLL